VVDLLHETGDQKTGQLFAHGPALLLVEAPQALFDWFRTGLDVECVLSDFLGDPWHFCRAPCKQVFVAFEEVDELTFLFGV
jgi:hypothetical protein